jgi:predicted nucleic acid binding AN1-type Zn finger protein
MIYKIITFVALCVLSIVPAYASDTANQIIETARKACTLEKGTFKASSEAVRNSDLNADGKLDEIIDEGKFSCSTASTLYCGTGGCMLHLIVGSKDYKFLSQTWVLAELGSAKVVITAIHWSECNYKTPCLKSVVWRDGKFRNLK